MIRTRFAPSPTGYLHLGNARTAIFSYLYARHHGGSFVLRIEDTDRERSSKEYEKSILEDLRWLGLDWDEMWRQSERFDIYNDFVDRLLESGHAYPCFCTPEELEREREEAQRRGIAYRYSGRCRHLGREEVNKLRKEGKPFAIRFRVPDGEEIAFRDLVKGYISINVDDFGDFIIVRSDGTPTYNLVVVIDDALMGITHVIRGEDHISNTPKQILIYRALGFDIPEFAHLPVILGEDRSKLSKRHGGVSVKYYREEGVVPEALFNYLCLLGWSPPQEGKEILSKEEIIRLFDLKDVNSSPAVFSRDKLLWMSGVYIREILSEDKLLEYALPFLEKAGYEVSDRDRLRRILSYTRDAYDTFSEMVERLRPFFLDPDSIPEGGRETLSVSEELVLEFLNVLKGSKPDTPEEVSRLAKAFLKEKGKKPKDLWKPIRLCLTGGEEGVGVDILLALLPYEVVERRIRKALGDH